MSRDVSRDVSPHPGGAVVVGYDGSPGARRALEWAAREAQRRRSPVRVAVAVEWSPLATAAAAESMLVPPDLERIGRGTAEEGVALLIAAVPGLEVSSAVRTGEGAVRALVAESDDAALVVVGARGRGAFAELLLGSTSAQVAVHAHCPVVVVQATGEQGRGVVVGVDASVESERAVAFALAAAADRGVGLTAVHAWEVPSLWGSSEHEFTAADLALLEQQEADSAAAVLAAAAVQQAGVVVDRRVVRGHPAQELLRAARGAELLVVGSRGRGGFRGLLLGSVSRAVLHHAGCPVAVVHGERVSSSG